MPSTIGLGQTIRGATPTDRRFAVPLTANQVGELVLPADLLARAGLDLADDVICEAGPDGLRVTTDTLRKVYVEITSRCNLACATCIRRAWDEPMGHMPVARFVRLLDGLPGASEQMRGEAEKQTNAEKTRAAGKVSLSSLHPITLSFSGFGEPLVHPDFLALVRLARERGIQVEIITNGTLLDARIAQELVVLGVSQVVVSIDGGSAAAYAAVRGHDLGPVVAAVRALVDARRRMRLPLTVGLAFVATRRNIASLPDLLSMAADLQVDFVSVSNVVPHTPEMAEEMLWGKAAWAANFPPESWRPRLIMGRIDLDERTRAALRSIWDRALSWPPPEADAGPQRDHCRFVHEGMTAVAWDGRVAPCLSLLHPHPEYINGHWKTIRSYVVGHVDEQPLVEIWREPGYRAFRGRLRTFDFPACFVCGGCPLTDSNEEDCYGNPFPVCGECLWAQGIVLCP